MTAKQFQKKISIAIRTGSAVLDDCRLFYHGDGEWCLEAFDGNVIDTCNGSPEKHFDYIVDRRPA